MEKNLETYNSEKVVSWYSHLDEITAVEKLVFEQFKNVLSQGNVLDIGIGGGRTTRYLKDKCKSYTGIDYSEKFIEATKSKFPNLDLSVMDARNLSQFKDESFDFVNFSFNGMDYVDLEGREKIFSEISRVLKSNGTFFFSTHNKDHHSFNLDPWKNKENSSFTNLKTFVKLFPYTLRKLRGKNNEVFTSDYAIINDSAHNYQLLTFYTSINFLKKQLEKNLFKEVKLCTKTGSSEENKKLDDWIFCTAQKI